MEPRPASWHPDLPPFLFFSCAQHGGRGGLDSLIASAAYLQAGRRRETAGSRSAGRSLVLPGPCPRLHSLCEQQPIGRRPSWDFLAPVPRYREPLAFPGGLQSWELAEEGPTKGSILQALVAAAAGAPAPGHPPLPQPSSGHQGPSGIH